MLLAKIRRHPEQANGIIGDQFIKWLPMGQACEYDPPLDPGIAQEVEILRGAGIETFESCQGGSGKGSRYSLNNRGSARAQEILESMFD